MLSVPSIPDAVERFKSTALGQMIQDPQLSPLVGSLYGSVVEATVAVGMQEGVGVSLPDLLTMFQGQVTVALVSPEEGRLALVAMVDTGEHIDKGKILLERLDTLLLSQGRSRTISDIRGTKVAIYGGAGTSEEPAIVFDKDNTLVIGSNPEVIGQMLYVWDGGDAETLSSNPNFRSVMRRCSPAGGDKPQAICYVDPIGILQTVGRDNTRLAAALLLFPALGLDGVSGAGGSVTLDARNFDMVVHGHVVLKTPREGVIKAIALAAGDSEPEPWVPPDVASYMTLHWNAEQTYEEAAYIYDTLNGEKALARLFDNGALRTLGLELEKDVLPALEGRITMLTWIERPVSVQSQATLVALKLNNTAAFDKAITTLRTSGLGQVLTERYWAGRTYYLLGPPPEPAPAMPGGMAIQQPVRQRPCIGMFDGYLVLADRESFFKKVLDNRNRRATSLADAEDFKTILERIKEQNGGNVPAMISFARPEETYRWLYDLAMAEQAQQTMMQRASQGDQFFQTLQGALQEHPLPSFEVLRKYLAPQGAMIIDEPTGLHYMSFTLRPPTAP